jgi:hypothetical protein
LFGGRFHRSPGRRDPYRQGSGYLIRQDGGVA